MSGWKRWMTLLLAASTVLAARAEEVNVAVAANFAAPMQKIAETFEKETGHKVLLSSGSTGKFAAQIRNGAPFQVLVAADDETPAALEKEGLAVAGTRYTYAIGTLVLWSAKPGWVKDESVLTQPGVQKVAIANPKLAPYGAAAMEFMAARGLTASVQPRLVQGENIAQTLQFISTGNADVGFVALSQVIKDGRIAEGSGWIVPESMHQPIRQDVVLLKTGEGKPAAQALAGYLKSAKARAVISSYGYRL